MSRVLHFQADRIEMVLASHKVPARVTGGIVTPRHGRLKVLGEGDLQKSLVVTAHAFSARAREKIEGGGGTAKVVA